MGTPSIFSIHQITFTQNCSKLQQKPRNCKKHFKASTLIMANYTMDLTELDNLSYTELQNARTQLEAAHRRILALQNAQSRLLRLPGELRNAIFLFAMYAELEERKKRCKKFSFREPAFFATNRQIRIECVGIWLRDVLVWEELVEVIPDQQPLSSEPKVEVDKIEDIVARKIESGIGPLNCSGAVKEWRSLSTEMVKDLHSQRSKTGQLALITERAHCDLKRLRDSIQGSRSICPRKGLARVQGWHNGAPSLRWWMW
ncbi:unnamed protein product [Cercospora beticola]|nr:unnamed protein product [Cercospora beticola]